MHVHMYVLELALVYFWCRKIHEWLTEVCPDNAPRPVTLLSNGDTEWERQEWMNEAQLWRSSSRRSSSSKFGVAACGARHSLQSPPTGSILTYMPHIYTYACVYVCVLEFLPLLLLLLLCLLLAGSQAKVRSEKLYALLDCSQTKRSSPRSLVEWMLLECTVSVSVCMCASVHNLMERKVAAIIGTVNKKWKEKRK